MQICEKLVSTMIYFRSMLLMRTKYMGKFCLLLACLLLMSGISAQDLVYNNENFAPERIKSIQMQIAGSEFSMPIVVLGSGTRLHLRFDDLDPEVKNFTYDIVHCDRNWFPTDLDRLDYLEGFEREELDDFKFSLSTRVPYTHYQLLLPNNDVSWKLSGNYALVVYDEDNDYDNPIFIRRFMVTEPKVTIFAQWTNPIGANLYNTHQELDFELTIFKNKNIQRPQSELRATLLQNYRWDTAIENIAPTVELSKKVVFNHQGKLLFPAGREFRNLDIRSLDSPLGSVHHIERTKDEILALTEPQKSRFYDNYSSTVDVNGQYIILNLEDPNSYNTRDANMSIDDLIEYDRSETGSSDISSDYARVVFAFDSEHLENHDIYIIGAFNDWALDDENLMVYDDDHGGYVKDILLKQGFYDYNFVAIPINEDGQKEQVDLEGSWFETNNIYTLLIYQKSFGARYEQLIGVRSFGSNE